MDEPYRWPRLRQLPEAERKPFWKWMEAQTRPIVRGVRHEDQDFYYPHDYERWKELNKFGWEVFD